MAEQKCRVQIDAPGEYEVTIAPVATPTPPPDPGPGPQPPPAGGDLGRWNFRSATPLVNQVLPGSMNATLVGTVPLGPDGALISGNRDAWDPTNWVNVAIPPAVLPYNEGSFFLLVKRGQLADEFGTEYGLGSCINPWGNNGWPAFELLVTKSPRTGNTHHPACFAGWHGSETGNAPDKIEVGEFELPIIPDPGQWYTIGVTWKELGELRLYLNGVLVKKKAATSYAPKASFVGDWPVINMHLGAADHLVHGGDVAFVGHLGAAALSGKQWTDADALAFHQWATGSTPPPPVSEVVANAGPDHDTIVGQTVTFTGSASGGKSPYTFAWSFSDGGQATGATVSHAFTTPGTHAATLRVTDADGQGDPDGDAAIVRVSSLPAPPPSGGEIVVAQDVIPTPVRQATLNVIKDGNAADPTVYDKQKVPVAGDVILVDRQTLLVDTALNNVQVCVAAGSKAVLARECKLNLAGGLYSFEGGQVDVQDGAQIVFADTPLDPADPEQWGNGLIVAGGFRATGPLKTAFVALDREPKAGDTALSLAAPVFGWLPGDRLVLPDTRALAAMPFDQWETPTILAISSDGKTLTLAAPLKYDHPASRNADGTVYAFPEVANLTRGIVVKSANARGVRGHCLFTGKADVDIQGVAFMGLGRTKIPAFELNPDGSWKLDAFGQLIPIPTGPLGRYPVHFRNLEDRATTGPRFRFEGCAVMCPLDPMPFKWGLTVFNSRNGLVKGSVLYNWGGGGIVSEDPAAKGTVYEGNFVCRVNGTGGRGDPNGGVGYWFSNTDNADRDNRAYNCDFYGATWYGGGPFRESKKFRAWSNKQAETMWHINGAGTGDANPAAPHSALEEHESINSIDGWGLGYQTYNVNFLRPKGRSNLGAPTGHGFFFGDYALRDSTLEAPDYEGHLYGIAIPTVVAGGKFIVRNPRIRCTHTFGHWAINNAGGGAGPDLTARRVELHLHQADIRPLVPGTQGWLMLMDFTTDWAGSDFTLLDQLYIYGLNGANYQVYWGGVADRDYPTAGLLKGQPYGQAADAIMLWNGNPAERIACPEKGLTNAQAKAKYGICTGGEIAPADATATLAQQLGIVGGLARRL